MTARPGLLLGWFEEFALWTGMATSAEADALLALPGDARCTCSCRCLIG